MIRTRTRFAYALLAIGGLVLAGCSQMDPAQKALAEVQATIDAASDQAGKYIPVQFNAAKQGVADLKAAFDAKDYRTVIANAPSVLATAKQLAVAAAAKKEEVVKAATADWASLSASLPALVATVKSRVDVLGKSKHLPAGVDLAAAKSALADATDGWAKAQAASASGNVEDAASLARTVKAKALAAAQALNLKLPGA
jgi:hypothetical protein